jgi:molybdopterin-containing oxidoreductase family membrane subunit
MIRCAATGGRGYKIWVGLLLAFVASTGFVYYQQLVEGLIVTHMSDEVCWGIGIANFVYFVGVAAAAVILVFPAYIYHNEELKKVVLIGELLAFVAIMMCLLFIYTDIGRPDRFWHLIPGIGGRLNLPSSMLGWDVIVFNGYLLLNMHVPGYLLYKMYLGEKPNKLFYMPFVLLSMLWAVSIHTVTAFLLSGLGVRYFWNTAVMAPRFLISAFASGPALLILIFTIIRNNSPLKISDSVFETMRRVMTYTLLMNLFLFGCEIFKEFYTNTWHAASAQYLLFGVNGRGNLKPWIWSSLVVQCIALALLYLHTQPLKFVDRWKSQILHFACIFIILGIWIEKGMGLVLPGFIPSPLGNFMEYAPSWHEVYICCGILALGCLVFTLTAKVSIAIQTGSLRKPTSVH